MRASSPNKTTQKLRHDGFEGLLLSARRECSFNKGGACRPANASAEQDQGQGILKLEKFKPTRLNVLLAARRVHSLSIAFFIYATT